MIDIMALLVSDTYKQTHDRMYPKDLTKLVSYWVPRKSMLKSRDTMVFFGLQAFIKEYLVDYWDRNFFKRELNDLIEEYKKYMNVQLGGESNYDLEKVVDLHRYGRLPLHIRALPEGSVVNMNIPCVELTATDPRFAWFVQWLECEFQAELWKSCNFATIGHMYKKAAKFWYETNSVNANPSMACSDFGMRGMSCLDEATKCSAAWLLSFDKTSTIPALPYIDKYYDANVSKNEIGIGAVSTEHSVICANYANDGDEATFLKRMLTEKYPNTSFSFLGDTYDYWNMLENVFPACKAEIMAHNGKVLIRPDSGDIVDISIKSVQSLWKNFGGNTNSKGYKVLDPHVGIIYGDGCTLFKVQKIWEELDRLGFAANNINFGVGAFCFTSFFDDGKIVVNTRDTFGVAMKATYAETSSKKLPIFKDPKTDTNNLKKSHKGCIKVTKTEDGKFVAVDGFEGMVPESETCLKTVFLDGVFVKTYTFEQIRKTLNSEI